MLRRPSMTSRSSSVSLPHFCLICPLYCFHLPSTWSQFMADSSVRFFLRTGRVSPYSQTRLTRKRESVYFLLSDSFGLPLQTRNRTDLHPGKPVRTNGKPRN